MAWGVCRLLAIPLLFLNLFMYCIVLGIAGWAINIALIDAQGFQARTFANPATEYFVVFALLAGVVGVASSMSSLQHIKLWCHESLSHATSPSWIAWLLTLLALGLSCKEIDMGGHRIKRMIALESFIIILSGTQMLYLLFIHAGIFCGEYGLATCATTPTHQGGKSEV